MLTCGEIITVLDAYASCLPNGGRANVNTLSASSSHPAYLLTHVNDRNTVRFFSLTYKRTTGPCHPAEVRHSQCHSKNPIRSQNLGKSSHPSTAVETVRRRITRASQSEVGRKQAKPRTVQCVRISFAPDKLSTFSRFFTWFACFRDRDSTRAVTYR